MTYNIALTTYAVIEINVPDGTKQEEVEEILKQWKYSNIDIQENINSHPTFTCKWRYEDFEYEFLNEED